MSGGGMTIKSMDKQLAAVGARIRELRLKQGFSQEAFADSCGINRSHMGEVERGECNVTFATLVTITHKLEPASQHCWMALLRTCVPGVTVPTPATLYLYLLVPFQNPCFQDPCIQRQ